MPVSTPPAPLATPIPVVSDDIGPLQQPPNLDDPHILLAEADGFAKSLKQQAQSTQVGGHGGHANPQFLFSKSADLMMRLMALARKYLPPPPASEAPKKEEKKVKDAPPGPG